MRNSFLTLLLLLVTSISSFAQDDLFGTPKEASKKGIVLGFNGSLDFPAADMAKRFGTSYRFGPSVMYKTQSNYIFGAKFDFIAGNNIREDSLLAGVHDKNGLFINNTGQRIGIGLFQRGFAVGFQGGKILSLSKSNANSGILLLTGAGFIQHRINIEDKDETVPQVRNEYEKGYDRLTNGWYVEQFAGFNMFDKNNLLNFHIGFDILAGFTRGRRDYLFDVRRKDDASRIDILFGLRGGLYIPIFKKKSEEIYFE